MSPEQINTFIQLLSNMFNQPNIAMTDEFFAPYFIAHVPIMPPLNRSGFKSFVQSLHAAFPDFRQEVHDTILSADRLVLRLTYHGIQRGDFMGIPATGCEVIMPAMCIFRIEQGMIVEIWMEMDIFGVINQISRMAPVDLDGRIQNLN